MSLRVWAPWLLDVSVQAFFLRVNISEARAFIFAGRPEDGFFGWGRMSAREWVDWVVGGCGLKVDACHLCGCYLWRLRKIGQEMWRGKKDNHSLKRSERKFPNCFFGFVGRLEDQVFLFVGVGRLGRMGRAGPVEPA